MAKYRTAKPSKIPSATKTQNNQSIRGRTIYDVLPPQPKGWVPFSSSVVGQPRTTETKASSSSSQNSTRHVSQEENLLYQNELFDWRGSNTSKTSTGHNFPQEDLGSFHRSHNPIPQATNNGGPFNAKWMIDWDQKAVEDCVAFVQDCAEKMEEDSTPLRFQPIIDIGDPKAGLEEGIFPPLMIYRQEENWLEQTMS